MKVMLVDPPHFFLEGRGATCQIQPLGLGYLGAVLAPHHDVRFLLPDTRRYEGSDPWGELTRVLAVESPDVVGITSVTSLYPAARRFAEVVKQVDPGIVTVLGGAHASVEPLASLAEAPDIDFVVQGEGEQTMLELVGALEKQRSGGAAFDPAVIAGLVWRDGAGLPQSSPARSPITDLDALPFPLREQLVWPQDIHPAFYQALITVRGCPYKCIYCAVPAGNNRLTMYRSPANVADEIALLRSRFDVPFLFFHDSVFTVHRQRILELCHTLVERGLVIPFACQTRADRIDPELLETMVSAGCQRIFLGIESGDVESLRRIGKKMTLKTIREAVRMVKGAGIGCSGFFMIGFPWETTKQMERTEDFACSLGLDMISLFSATPLPGTELWRLTGGLDLPESIDFRKPQINLTSLPDDEYRALFDRIKARIDAYNHSLMTQQLQHFT